METINGAYSSAQIFTTKNKDTAIDQYALSQLQMICDQEASAGCQIRVMPDVHPGMVGTIGLTMIIGQKIMPNLIGIDTLDEAPFAYRTIDDIVEVISDTVTINDIIRPVYNFKAGGK